jgi:hypothetical protein
MVEAKVMWGDAVKKKRVYKVSDIRNKYWCPDMCGKRVGMQIDRSNGKTVVRYVCTICNREFTKCEMLESYGKSQDQDLN